MKTYTAFCQQLDGRGTTWIDSVEAESERDAMELAILNCSADWNYDPDNIRVLGIAEGNVTILYWADIDE